MLIGEYVHSIDTKKRLSIPAKFRKEIGKRGVLTRGLDRSLFLYPQAEWEQIAEKLSRLPAGQASTRGFVRLMLAGALDVEIDSLGRILVPDYLKEYAGIGESAVITGVYNRLEIWDERVWNEYKARIEKEASDIAEKLGEVGAF